MSRTRSGERPNSRASSVRVTISGNTTQTTRPRRYSQPVLTSDLVWLYPFLFHTAADGSWPNIREHGLLSTAAMLKLWEVEDGQRRELLKTVRADSVVIEHPRLGSAVVRD